MLFFKKKEPRPAPALPEPAPNYEGDLHTGPSVPTGMWEKCPSCNNIVYTEELEQHMKVCPHCKHHFRLSARQRIQYTADEGSFEEMDAALRGVDPLGFPGYADKLRSARAFSGLEEAILTGTARIENQPCVLCAMDSNFMMASMGAAVGEKFARAAERALALGIPMIVFTASGGARMQEGMVSLMQMAKCSGAVMTLHQAGIPYIVVLTDPTTGGVTASFAMLGDITLAEPGALVGFAGQRVIQQTTRQSLPPGFQRAEFLIDKGFVDVIVPRADMAATLAHLLRLHDTGAATKRMEAYEARRRAQVLPGGVQRLSHIAHAATEAPDIPEETQKEPGTAPAVASAQEASAETAKALSAPEQAEAPDAPAPAPVPAPSPAPAPAPAPSLAPAPAPAPDGKHRRASLSQVLADRKSTAPKDVIP